MNETQVGKRLSDITTKRAIFLMFSVMVSIPFFDYSTYWESTNSFQTSIQLLTSNYDTDLFDIYEQSFLNFHKSIRTPLLSLVINEKVYYEASQLKTLRPEEEQIYMDEEDNVMTTIIISIMEDVQLGAYLGLARTTFVIIIMVAGAIFFSKDTNDLVVIPIENMLQKIKRISNNPLEAAKMEEEREILEQELMEGGDEKQKERFIKENNDETKILEKLIVKTASLLAVGFG